MNKNTEKQNNLGIYIHIPFCLKKCLYCNFYSLDKYKNIDIKKYCSNLVGEIKNSKIYNIRKNETTSLYFGGGTPSILSLTDLKTIFESLNLGKKIIDIEVTLEVNPESIGKNILKEYKKLGINRLSVGAQTFLPSKLKTLGRIHTSQKTKTLLKEAKKIGLNFNVDIIFGLKDDTLKSILEDLNAAIDLGANHISFYSLELEKNSTLNLCSEKLNREIYHKCVNFLRKKGFKQYEISNFSLKGYESKHNLNYFNFGEYIGFGAGAHSFYEKNNNFYRYKNKKVNNNFEYKNVLYKVKNEELIKEYIIFGLRKNHGFQLIDFENRFGVDFLEMYKNENETNLKNKLITINKNKVCLTKKGFDLYNTAVSLYM